MTTMTDHIEGSARVHTSIWEQAKADRLSRLERKAERKARHAGAPFAYIRTTVMSDRLGFEARGWELESSTSVGIATPTRYVLKRTLTS